jgi:hypothetical protein
VSPSYVEPNQYGDCAHVWGGLHMATAKVLCSCGRQRARHRLEPSPRQKQYKQLPGRQVRTIASTSAASCALRRMVKVRPASSYSLSEAAARLVMLSILIFSAASASERVRETERQSPRCTLWVKPACGALGERKY